MPGLDETYIEMCEIWAGRSHAERLKVAALIVKDRMIISDGYNGMPSGFPNKCEFRDETRREVLHAEANAITKLAQNGGAGCRGATLYTLVSPCFDCAKLIIQSGISRVVYRDEYRKDEGVKLLLKAGIKIKKV